MRKIRLPRLSHAIVGLALFLFMLATPVSAYSEMSQMQEYEVKAAFLFAFAKLTEWPKSAEASANNFVMCVLGDNPFGDNLDSLVGRTVGGQNISIQIVSDTKGTSACNLLFVSSSEKRRLSEIIAYVRSRPILTVSDISGFEKDGGIIAFFLKANRVRFRINIAAAEKARLKLSSHLLEVADVVTGRVE
ncbi:MAG: YfiR family protein [Nitrospirae bacterium]|nr:YfiR family protein [Nitrospirota bacterium]